MSSWSLKLLERIGLGFFLAGFFIFLVTFFTSSYKLTQPIIQEVILEKNARLTFSGQAESLIGNIIGSNFEFVSQLDQIFQEINNKQLELYGITPQELDQLIDPFRADSPLVFQIDRALHIWSESDEVGSFKRKAFGDYGSWLNGREFSSPMELESQLQIVALNISNHEIMSQKGFDRYRIKNLKYDLTKASSITPVKDWPLTFILLTYVLTILGAGLYLLPKKKTEGPPGIKNNRIFQSSMKNGGWLGILTGTFLIAFYVILYFYPEYMTNWIIMVDPISYALKNSEAGRFFLYGFIYTLCIPVMGVRMLIKYRHSKYQIARTFSVMFFQTSFAFLIPEILIRLNQPYFDFKNIWPLDYDFFFDSELNKLIQSGSLGVFMLGWGIALIVIAVPVLVYFFGKRWYCSWVCGCGGLAETLGDPYRQLSNKSLKAWKAERIIIHAVLVFAVLMTAGVLYTYWTGSGQLMGISTYTVREVYGAWIGAGFAGVIGTGFYPLMGNRVWCRFGCPLAAYLGFVQRFKSRFRITTNGGQCISCGNCSTYCEMGIDVKWYAQRGQNIIRSSCVGCGICSSVCPRGVLNLENRNEEGRFGTASLLGNNSFPQIGNAAQH